MGNRRLRKVEERVLTVGGRNRENGSPTRWSDLIALLVRGTWGFQAAAVVIRPVAFH